MLVNMTGRTGLKGSCLSFEGRWCAATVLSEEWPEIEDVRVGFGEPSCAERFFVL